MFLVYLALRLIMRKDIDEYFVSLGLLSYELTGRQIATRVVTTSILSGIDGLLSSKLVKRCDNNMRTRQNDWILDLSKLHIDNVKEDKKNNKQVEYYTPINLDHISNILNSKDIQSKLELIRFYCYLMTTLQKTGEKKGVGFTSYTDMASQTGITRQTISKYMDNLENEKIIHIYRSTDSILYKGTNEIKEIPNVYGDINDKKLLNKIGSKHESMYGENATRIRNTRVSNTRSASAKLAVIKRDLETTGEIRYGYDEMKDIYETLKEYNKRNIDNEHIKQKELHYFKHYDFYKE